MINIKKRDGSLQRFDSIKIRKSILMAFDACGEPAPVVGQLVGRVSGRINDGMPVAGIQDLIESELMDSGFTRVAKAYILYRASRDSARAVRMKPDNSQMSDYVTVTKYSKHLEAAQRREVYPEICERNMHMHIDRFPSLESRIREIYGQFVVSKRVLPSMRSMQFAGPKISKHNGAMYNCSFTHVDRVRVFAEAMYLLLCGCGVGFSVQFKHVGKLPPVLAVDDTLIRHHTIDDSIEGWAEAVYALCRSYLVPGEQTNIEFNYSRIRAEGTPLRTTGGKAPGHLGLKRSLESARGVFASAVGRRLRPLECHDIMCHVADAVLSGGIRRSSLISLFSPEDSEMMHCKMPGVFSHHGLNNQRQMANNSVVLLRSEDNRSVFDRCLDIAESCYGDPGFYFTNDLDYGCNPCYAPGTMIATDRGWERVEEAQGTMYLQDTGRLERGSAVQQTGKDVPIVDVDFDNGSKVSITPYHEMDVVNRGRVKAKDLKIGDKIHLQYKERESWGCEGTFEDGFTAGFWTGDGTSDGNLQYLDVWKDDFKYLDFIQDCANTENDWHGDDKKQRLRIKINCEKGFVPSWVWKGTRKTVCGYLQGLFFADGNFQGTKKTGYSLRLSQSDKNYLQQIQILLSGFGMYSRIRLCYPEKMKEMPGGVYKCKANYELLLDANSSYKFMEDIGMIGKNYHKYLKCGRKYSLLRFVPKYALVTSVKDAGISDVWCMNVYATHNLMANGLFLGQCGEIGLDPRLKVQTSGEYWSEIGADRYVSRDTSIYVKEGKNAYSPSSVREAQLSGFAFCNLTEVNGALCETEEDFILASRAAAFIGTLQAAYTDFGWLDAGPDGAVSKCIAERDALLGVGIMGITNRPSLLLDAGILTRGAEAAVSENRSVASMLGIRPARRVTTVKPSGKASKVASTRDVVVGAGIHPVWARRWIQGITAKRTDPPSQYLRSVNPHMVREKPNGDWFIEFPMQVADTVLTVRDLSATQQIDNVMRLYESWVVPGSLDRESGIPAALTHNVSCTVSVRPGEDIKDYIWDRRHRIAAMAFFPLAADAVIPFAPCNAVQDAATEARFNELVRLMVPVDWSRFQEATDNTTQSLEPACVGGSCEL